MGEKAIQVILTDDDLDDRIMFADALKATHLKVNLITANNGVVLLDYLNAHLQTLPDILFLDLNMPLKNGFESFTEIKNNPALKNLRVVIFSTSGSRQVIDKLYEAGADFFIQKPFDFRNLVKLIEYAITRISEIDFKQPIRAEFMLGDDLTM